MLALSKNILLITVLVISAFAGGFFLKYRINRNGEQTGFDFISFLVLSYEFWVSICLYFLAFLALIYLLKINDLSKIFPLVVGINILITLIGSSVFLGESLDILKIAGATCIVLGIMLFFLS